HRGLEVGQRVVRVEEGAPVEDLVALPARRHQSGGGKHLEVVAQRRLTYVEDTGHLQHAQRIGAQQTQDLQAQRIARGLAQERERVGVLENGGRRVLEYLVVHLSGV